jgi:hypothetical protein
LVNGTDYYNVIISGSTSGNPPRLTCTWVQGRGKYSDPCTFDMAPDGKSFTGSLLGCKVFTTYRQQDWLVTGWPFLILRWNLSHVHFFPCNHPTICMARWTGSLLNLEKNQNGLSLKIKTILKTKREFLPDVFSGINR